MCVWGGGGCKRCRGYVQPAMHVRLETLAGLELIQQRGTTEIRTRDLLFTRQAL